MAANVFTKFGWTPMKIVGEIEIPAAEEEEEEVLRLLAF